MNRKQAIKTVDELADMASVAQNFHTGEPMYYDIINRTEHLRELLTPWHERLWREWKARRPIKDSEIPF